MKFAVFGDIHANLEGFEAVLLDAAANDCTHFLCIGDVVGYNANPRECMQLLQKLECPVIRGNHDEEASGHNSLEGLNPLAARAMEWTRDSLTPEDKEWLQNLPFVRQIRDFTAVHSTLDSPENWGYVMSKFDALASFSYQFTQICFYGHTHHPLVYIKDEGVEQVKKAEIQIEKNRKYFVNVGSCGQPRDGDWRAAYTIYDVENQVLHNRRIDYDLQKAQDKIVAAGLPEMLANRLAVGK